MGPESARVILMILIHVCRICGDRSVCCLLVAVIASDEFFDEFCAGDIFTAAMNGMHVQLFISLKNATKSMYYTTAGECCSFRALLIN